MRIKIAVIFLLVRLAWGFRSPFSLAKSTYKLLLGVLQPSTATASQSFFKNQMILSQVYTPFTLAPNRDETLSFLTGIKVRLGSTSTANTWRSQTSGNVLYWSGQNWRPNNGLVMSVTLSRICQILTSGSHVRKMSWGCQSFGPV